MEAQEVGSRVSQDPKPLAPAPLSPWTSLTNYKFNDEIIVKNFKTANAEH